jgi:acetylornithine deacetylase/succinyl-diaminopimelate desuccinylase-like protein
MSARFASDLATFVRFASVGADPRRNADVAACARWLADRLRRAGLHDVVVLRTAGHPAVLGSWLRAPGAPTVLVYGHYDVQPAEPLAAWRTPPFAAVRVGDELFGRGACDDKGPLLCHVAALERRLAAGGRLPVNVVCVFEGEEESGSPHLGVALDAVGERAAPDVAVVSDTRMRDAVRPAIVVGTRGVLSVRAELRRTGGDAHAGQFGGAIADPAAAMARVVAALHDERGRIAVPGLYDRVRRLGAGERGRLARDGPSDAELLRDARAGALAGEMGFSGYERTTVRPALTVTGLAGGYAGPGAKSAVPTRAEARLDLRLVPDQRPAEVERLVRERLRALAPAGLTLHVDADEGSPPTTIDPRHPALRAAAEACRRGFGMQPALMRSGGTVPIVAALRQRFGVPTVLVGFARPQDGMHAPNERVHLPTLHRGTVTCLHLHELLAVALRRTELAA